LIGSKSTLTLLNQGKLSKFPETTGDKGLDGTAGSPETTGDKGGGMIIGDPETTGDKGMSSHNPPRNYRG